MDIFRSVTQSVLGTPQPGQQQTSGDIVSLIVFLNILMKLTEIIKAYALKFYKLGKLN